MEELTYGELFRQLKMQVEKIFCYPHYKNSLNAIVDFLIHQGVENMSIETIQKIEYYHSECSEEEMFNWIHCDDKESPFEIKNAPYPEDMGNVLVLEDGTCIFWYEIGVGEKPYSPFDREEDFEESFEKEM